MIELQHIQILREKNYPSTFDYDLTYPRVRFLLGVKGQKRDFIFLIGKYPVIFYLYF